MYINYLKASKVRVSQSEESYIAGEGAKTAYLRRTINWGMAPRPVINNDHCETEAHNKNTELETSRVDLF